MLRGRAGRLLLAQVDHVSGEVVGFALGELMEKGARNVQVVSTVTKKNRPGSLLIVDIDPEKEEMVALYLARELGVSGYHRIDTTHAFTAVSFVEQKVEVRQNGHHLEASCLVKLVGPSDAPLSCKAEHADLVRLKDAIAKQLRTDVALDDLRLRVEDGARGRSEKALITLPVATNRRVSERLKSGPG